MDSALLFFHCKKRRQSLVHWLLRPRGVKQAIYVEWTHFMKTSVLHLHRQQGVSRGPTAHKRMNWNARGQRQPTAPCLQPIYKQEYACLLRIKEEKILWLVTVAKKRKKEKWQHHRWWGARRRNICLSKQRKSKVEDQKPKTVPPMMASPSRAAPFSFAPWPPLQVSCVGCLMLSLSRTFDVWQISEQ